MILNKLEWPQSSKIEGIYEKRTGKMYPATVRVLRHLGMKIVDINELDLIANEEEEFP